MSRKDERCSFFQKRAQCEHRSTIIGESERRTRSYFVLACEALKKYVPYFSFNF